METNHLIKANLDFLVDQLREKEALVRAQKLRIEFLESRLAQRSEETHKDFQRLQPYIESMQRRILETFHSLPAERGLTMPEVQEEFSLRFPNIPATHVPRRVYELIDQKKLWKQNGQDETMLYYLTLKDTGVGSE